MNETAMDILNAREERVCFQEEVMDRYKNNTLISVRVNYPGAKKNTALSRNIYFAIEKIILDIFKYYIRLTFFRITAEGPVGIFIVNRNSKVIKQLCMKVEDSHPIGRFVDIDVYDGFTRKSLSRTGFGASPRKCYLCDNIAQECVRNRTHDIEKIIKYMEEVNEKFVKNRR